jgi:hypothetical protein
MRRQEHVRYEPRKRIPSELLLSVKREHPSRRTMAYVPASAESGAQGTEKSGITFWGGGGKRRKGLRSALRIPEVRSAARRHQGKRSPERTRYTGTGRRNKGCRSYPPRHDLTEWREPPDLRRSRRKPMPFRRKTDRLQLLSSSRDGTRPLPKWKRTGRARGAQGRFSEDSNAGTFIDSILQAGGQATIILKISNPH